MALTVPFRRGQQGAGQRAQLPEQPPPSSYFLLTAAAKMHAEGRLIADDQSGTDAKLNTVPDQLQEPIKR